MHGRRDREKEGNGEREMGSKTLNSSALHADGKLLDRQVSPT